jgi:hypothetical protein
MPKKHRLDSKYDDDFTLFGIVSHLKDYRLIWSINEKMHLHLVKMSDLKIFQDKKNEFNFFSLYYYDEPHTFKTYYFISNNGEKGSLFAEHKQTNYFLLIKGNVSPALRNEIVKDIYTIVNVLTVHHIPISIIKNAENFFSDLELDMMEMLKEKNAPNIQPKK